MIKDVVSHVMVEMFEAGETILEKGTHGKGLFFITEGECDVIVPSYKSRHGDSNRAAEEERELYGRKGMELVRAPPPPLC